MTRFHLIANAHGLPIRAELSGGEVSNFKGFDALVDDDLPEVSDVSAYGTNQRDYLREDFWLIVVTEGNADETEIADTSDWCGQGDQGHPPGNA